MSIFNKETLDRLNSPEQLDTALHIRSPIAWMALIAIGVLAGILLVWSIVGSIQQRVAAMGMVMPEKGGVFTLRSRATGVLVSLEMTPGAKIRQGQLVAHIRQPLLVNQIKDAKKHLASLQADLKKQETFDQTSNEQRKGDLRKQVRLLNEKISTLKKRLSFLQVKKRGQKGDLQKGFITRDQYEQTLSSISQVTLDIGKARQAIGQAQIDLKNAIEGKFTRIEDQKLQVQRAIDHLRELETQMRLASEVHSPVAGFVADVAAKPGDTLTIGGVIAHIEPIDTDMIVRAYVRPQDGKEIKPGMIVHISPTSVESSIYGTMVGKVQWVSELPESRASLMDVFENKQVVSEMNASGSPFAMIVHLNKDKNTYSGFAWTSSKGPNVHISPGTLCSAAVVVREQHPINLIVPILSSWVPHG